MDKTLITFQKKFTDFLKSQHKAVATIVAYEKDISQLIEYLSKKQITQITSVLPEHIESFKEYLAANNYTTKSISRKLNSLKTFFRWLKNSEQIDNDPAAGILHPKYEVAPPRILTKMEYRALRDSARNDPRAAAVIEMLLQTGMKIGELARLELSDIKDKEVRIAPFESRQERTVPLNPAAKKILQRWLNFRPKSQSQSLFITKTGRPFLIRNIRTSINRFLRSADINGASINSLRHTFIAHQLMAGAPAEMVQKLVGHKRLSTTEKYLDLVKDKVEKTAKLEEL